MAKEKKIHVEYFALLSQEAGKPLETVHTAADTLEDLLTDLYHRYPFSLPQKQIQASLNNQLPPSCKTALVDGDHVILLTPLMGG